MVQIAKATPDDMYEVADLIIGSFGVSKTKVTIGKNTESLKIIKELSK